MSLLSKLFGGSGAAPKSAPEAESIEYNGFAITPTPIKEASSYRVSAKIEKQVEGELKSHTLIRADTSPNLEETIQTSIRKARQMIDEQGERLFR